MRTEIRVPGLVCVEHTLEVPLDDAAPDQAKIELFAREVADPDGTDRPFLVYLQGGPVSRPPDRRVARASRLGWIGRSSITGCCCWTSGAPVARPRSEGLPAWTRPRRLST